MGLPGLSTSRAIIAGIRHGDSLNAIAAATGVPVHVVEFLAAQRLLDIPGPSGPREPSPRKDVTP